VSYEAWRATFQSSEQAARAAYKELQAARAQSGDNPPQIMGRVYRDVYGKEGEPVPNLNSEGRKLPDGAALYAEPAFARRDEVEPVAPGDPLPCPFCGSTDVGGAGGTVGCYRCPAEIAVQNANTAYAVELWNNRASKPPTPAAKILDVANCRTDFWATAVGGYQPKRGDSLYMMEPPGDE